MKKIFIAINLVGLFFITTQAQTLKQKNNDAFKDKIVELINSENAIGIYSLAGVNFKKGLNEEAFQTFCQNNLFPLGDVKKVEFEKIENGVSSYKVNFSEKIFTMLLSVEADGFSVFGFKPHVAKATYNNTKITTDNILANSLDKKIEELLQPFMFESKTVGLSIGILKKGKNYFYNYGETKKGSGKIPSAKNLYEIGSVTKTFTGILLAKAVTENKINLSDPVNKYLPKNIPIIKFGNDTVKIIHLANHTSGLPPLPDNFDFTNEKNPYLDYDDTKLYTYLKNAKLVRKPGEKFEYCNLAVGLLGNILERVNKMSFEKTVTTFITSKYGMTDTKQYLSKKDSALFVQGYNENILANSQWDFKALAAAGCLRSNTADMLQYAQLNLDTTTGILQKAIQLSHQITFNDSNQKIALNWFLQNWGWGSILFHGGETGGFKSFLAINPKTKNAVIILSNTAVTTDQVGVKILSYLDKN